MAATMSSLADSGRSDLDAAMDKLSIQTSLPELNEEEHADKDATEEEDDRCSDCEERQGRQQHIQEPRPTTPRRVTDPTPSSLLPPPYNNRRNRSPYSRSHFRSHSSSCATSCPPMTRAHSLPAHISTPSYLSLSPAGGPASPLRSPARIRSPFKDESFTHSGAPSVCDISEDSELELTPRAGHHGLSSPTPSNAFPRTRRRPVSPLHQMSNTPFGGSGSTASSVHSSPLLLATKFNETFPPNIHYPLSSYSSSSVPSTPTSTRSRSPSISSLETIPDIPDAEAAAIEAEKLEAEKRAAEGASEPVGRRSLDAPGPRIGLVGFGARDKRKRWSVCGGERRQDLDLETIWEGE